MTRLLIPARIAADIIISVLGLLELKEKLQARRLKKQQSTSSSDDKQDR